MEGKVKWPEELVFKDGNELDEADTSDAAERLMIQTWTLVD